MPNGLRDNLLEIFAQPGAEHDDAHAVTLLGTCLPLIVPNVILAKRQELIPLLLCGIHFHPRSEVRDNLLHILFNLIKKPDQGQRNMILRGE